MSLKVPLQRSRSCAVEARNDTWRDFGGWGKGYCETENEPLDGPFLVTLMV